MFKSKDENDLQQTIKVFKLAKEKKWKEFNKKDQFISNLHYVLKAGERCYYKRQFEALKRNWKEYINFLHTHAANCSVSLIE